MGRTLKILLIDVNYGTSSTGRLVKTLRARLMEAGHIVAACYGRGVQEDQEGIFKFGMDWETRAHALSTRLFGRTGHFSALSTWRLIRYINSFQPDVVHIHELHGYFVRIPMLLSYLSKLDVRVVWTLHCEFMYTGRCGIAGDCLRFQTGCGNCPKLSDYPRTLFFDRSRKMHQQKKALLSRFRDLHLIVPSDWLAERVAMSFLSTKPCNIIYNPIDFSIFYPRNTEDVRMKAGYLQKRPMLLSVMTADAANKGFSLLLELAKRMPGAHFVHIGFTPSTQISLPTNLTCLGRMEDSFELAIFYSFADLFLLLSKIETFSLPCAEALACGTSVVGFCAGGPERVFPSPYGDFVPYGDLDMLTSLIHKKLLERPDANECVGFAKKHFDVRQVIAQVLALYYGR